MIQLSTLFFSSEPQLLCGIDVAFCFYLLLICKLCFLYNAVFSRGEDWGLQGLLSKRGRKNKQFL